MNTSDSQGAAQAAPTITMPEATALRFLQAVEGLFIGDRNWSVLDLDGAAEFYEAAGIVPDPEATATE